MFFIRFWVFLISIQVYLLTEEEEEEPQFYFPWFPSVFHSKTIKWKWKAINFFTYYVLTLFKSSNENVFHLSNHVTFFLPSLKLKQNILQKWCAISFER